ncbi:POK25 protein, partial [Podargus strigoides]|nr:POK25 protein [Podargus strigoides]
LQKLLGTIHWVRPRLGIANHELSHLFSTLELSHLFSALKGDSDLLSKRQLTPEAKQELNLVAEKISTLQADRIRVKLPICLFILLTQFQPIGLIGQTSDDNKHAIY